MAAANPNSSIRTTAAFAFQGAVAGANATPNAGNQPNPAPAAAPASPQAQPAARHEKLVEYFETLLTSYLAQGVDCFRFESDGALQVGREGRLQVLDRVVLPGSAVEVFVRRVLSVAQLKPYEEIAADELRSALGARQQYDLVVNGPRGLMARTLQCQISEAARGFALEMNLEPLFLLGYGTATEPAALDDAQLTAWLDDFATRLIQKKNPTPKDVIFSPNKENPYVTVTGGLKPIEDVVVAGGSTTARLAWTMIRIANNPLVNEKIRKNQGILTGLDLDLAYTTQNGRRFRVNIADSFDNSSDHGPLITMRLLPEKPWTTTELPLPRAVLDTVMNTRMGLVLICGTTGSGKSTTMGVIIDYLLKNKSINLLTIENPIETMFPSKLYPRSIISQRELGKHTAHLHRGLESAVRQTLNMAMVGEIRNAEDATMALELAQSGHLIFATLHAGSVGESIRRIIDMFPADQEKKVREMLAAQYKLGMAQILVKGQAGQSELVLEVMKTNAEIKLLMLDQQTRERQLSMRELLEWYSPHTGTRSLDMALVDLYRAGKISEDTMMFNSPDPDALVHRQSKLGIKLSTKWDATGALIAQDTSQRLSMVAVGH